MPEIDALLQRFENKNRLALSRLLSIVARGEHLTEIADSMRHAKPAKTIAVTGSGGVGKSTLIGRLIEHIRAKHHQVAILACDPQSPLTGGALLGDRFRVPDYADDEGVYFRSLAAVSGHGAIADHLPVMAKLLGEFGFDVVLIETVGSGQGDVAIAEIADVVVLLLQPETGDDLQWEKAGVLEIADVIAVQKADLPGAEHVAAQVRATLSLSNKPPVPVLLTSAKTGKGLDELTGVLDSISAKNATPPDPDSSLLKLAQETLARRFQTAREKDHPGLARLREEWKNSSRDEAALGEAVLRLMHNDSQQ